MPLESKDNTCLEVIMVGGGQAGLAMGRELAARGLPFLILDAGAGPGASWRDRWDSLRLFTPAAYSALPGLPFPVSP
ncbi:MAG: NAD(P)-binding protein, partial [Chloroflexota bacterium]